MIVLKTAKEIELMKEACRISAEALKVAGEAVKPGVTTWEIDHIAYEYIKKHGAEPNFLHLYGFPATACISINDEIIHGIPSKKRVIREGDIVSIDLGAKFTATTAIMPLLSLPERFPTKRSGCATPQKRACIRASKRLSLAADSVM